MATLGNELLVTGILDTPCCGLSIGHLSTRDKYLLAQLLRHNLSSSLTRIIRSGVLSLSWHAIDLVRFPYAKFQPTSTRSQGARHSMRYPPRSCCQVLPLVLARS